MEAKGEQCRRPAQVLLSVSLSKSALPAGGEGPTFVSISQEPREIAMAVAAEKLEPRVFDQVEGVLTYLIDTGIRPASYNYEPPPGVPQRTGVYAEHRLPVTNGRRHAEGFSLDIQGFELRPHQTAVRDFYDTAEIERVYYPEVEALLKQVTGAEKVVTFDHTLRVGP